MADKPQEQQRARDWERIKIDYRAGVKSVREIAAEHGVSHTAINKKAKAEGWERNLREAVRARAEALVSKALVSEEVSETTLATEKLVVEVEAQVQARIQIQHRTDIGRARKLVMQLFQECEVQAEHVPELEQIGEILRSGDEGRMAEVFQRAISLPQRIKGVKDLSEALRIVVGMEREAFNILPPEPTNAGGLKVVAVKDYTGRG